MARIPTILLLAALLPTPMAQAMQTSSQSELHAERSLVRGLTLLRTGNPERAAAELTEGLKISPTEPALLAAMADAQRVMGDLASAQFYVNKALEFAPDDASVLRQAIVIEKESGDLQAALDAASHLVRTQPGDVGAILELIDLQNSASLYKEALATATRAERRFADFAPLLLAKVDILESLGRLDEAIDVLERLVLITEDTETLFRLAGAQIQSDEPVQAARSLVRLLENDPWHTDALVTLTDLLERPVGNEILAHVPPDLQERLQIDDSFAQDDPLSSLRRRLDLEPGNAQLALEYGEALLEADRHEDAASLALEHVEADPSDIGMWGLGVRALVEAEEFSAAIEFSDEAILLFPGYVPLLYERARALAGGGDAEQAAQILRRALERMEPDHAMRPRLEAYLARLGNPQ